MPRAPVHYLGGGSVLTPTTNSIAVLPSHFSPQHHCAVWKEHQPALGKLHIHLQVIRFADSKV